METGITLLLIAIGVGVGVLIGMNTRRPATNSKKTKGTIHVDCSDPTEPYFYLELTVSATDVVSQKQVVFDVNVHQHNSRK